MLPDHPFVDLDRLVVRAERLGYYRGMFALIRGSRRIEAGGVCQNRLAVQARHQCEQSGAVDAARQEHAVRNVAALMQIDALFQRAIQPFQRRVLIDVLRAALGDVRHTAAVQHVAVGAGQCLAGQQALDAFEDRLGTGGELQLQQLLARRGPHHARHQSCLQQRLRFRGERQPAGYLGDVQRLDAERVARQRHRALHAFMDCDRVHATQVLRVVGALAQPQMQRRFAVAVGGKADPRHRHAQFAVIVDLAVADQRGGTGEQRLVAGHQIDDRQPVMHQRDPAHHRVAGAIRAAVTQAVDQFRQRSRFGWRRAAR